MPYLQKIKLFQTQQGHSESLEIHIWIYLRALWKEKLTIFCTIKIHETFMHFRHLYMSSSRPNLLRSPVKLLGAVF